MLTHYNVVVNAVQFSTWLGMNTQDVHLAALPLFHIYGMTTAMNAPIFTAGSIVLTPDPRDTEAILQIVEKFKVTIFCGVPTIYQALINQPNIRRRNLSSLRVCISGASSLPSQVQIEFEKIIGGRLVEGYGLTEMSPVTHVNPLDHPAKNRLGSIGIPILDTDAKIVDTETGTVTLPEGEQGELVVRGPQAMKGYWHADEETEISLRDGWVYTGDIAVMDSDGYFRIVDRKKDMINVSGLKVWPQEIEAVLYENLAVKEAAAVAVPDPDSGEAIKAFVVLKDEYRGRVSESDVINFCRERIANYKAPKIVVFRDTLPRSSIGKVLRRELRAYSD
jgi:long-chain acyl-CoA synthetase